MTPNIYNIVKKKKLLCKTKNKKHNCNLIFETTSKCTSRLVCTCY